MPSQYAHYRFGKQTFPNLPPEARSCIQRFRRLYEMGQQGPDIFFYYNPLWNTAAGDIGHQVHQLSGQAFFTQACAVASSEAAMAYLYGLLGHYCLDSLCHPFVNKTESAGEAKHVPLEKEFDRYLMAADKLPSPHTQDLSPRIKLTRGECVTVAAFYPPATAGNVHQSVRFMGAALHYLSGPKREKREKLLRRIKPELMDHQIPTEPVEAFQRFNSELLVRYRWALEKYPDMVSALIRLKTDGEPLGDDFLPIFG